MYAGQLRYIRDLLNAYEQLEVDARFVFIGSTPTPREELRALFAKSPRRWSYLPFIRSNRRGSWFFEQFHLRSMLSKVGADMYHGFHTVAPLLASCPVVCTVHDLMIDIFPEYRQIARSKTYRLFKFAVRHKSDQAICISQCTADDLKKLWKIPESKTSVILHGSTFSQLDAMEPVPNGPTIGAQTVLSPFNLEPRKNLFSLIRAFANVAVQVPQAKLVLYGDAATTPERVSAYKSLISELNLTDRVVRTGVISDRQLLWLYKNTRLFAFPSLYEGFGYPVLEAMASGACVVARRASAMAEVVGDAGTLIETQDEAAMKNAIITLLRDNALCRNSVRQLFLA
ncbi:MAG: glycosyltransferase family 1 protein [Pirellulales bacterium]